MADYPGKVISGGFISGARSNSSASRIANSALLLATSKSLAIVIVNSSLSNAVGKSTGKLIYQQINDVLSQNKAYFNNGFSQNSQNVFLSKSALGLSTELNLSLEALFVAVLIQLMNNAGTGTDSKVNALWLAYGDKDDDKLYFIGRITFKKVLTILDTYEVQPIYSISPLDL